MNFTQDLLLPVCAFLVFGGIITNVIVITCLVVASPARKPHSAPTPAEEPVHA